MAQSLPPPAPQAAAAAAAPLVAGAKAAAAALSAADVVLLTLCAALGPALGGLLKLPAKYLIGPMFLSAL